MRARIAPPMRTPASAAASSPRIQSLPPRPALTFCVADVCTQFPLTGCLVQIWHPNRRSARRRRARTCSSAPTSAPSGRRASPARLPSCLPLRPAHMPPSPSRVRRTLSALPMTASSLSAGRWQEVRRPRAGQDARRGVEEPDRCRQGQGRLRGDGQEVGAASSRDRRRAVRTVLLCVCPVSLLSQHDWFPHRDTLTPKTLLVCPVAACPARGEAAAAGGGARSPLSVRSAAASGIASLGHKVYTRLILKRSPPPHQAPHELCPVRLPYSEQCSGAQCSLDRRVDLGLAAGAEGRAREPLVDARGVEDVRARQQAAPG